MTILFCLLRGQKVDVTIIGQEAAVFINGNKHGYKICKIGGFHGGDYEEWCLQECDVMWIL
jgi:hypothetical protein